MKMITNSALTLLRRLSAQKYFFRAILCSLLLPATSRAAVITFDFTGQLTLASDDYGEISALARVPVSASMIYDTQSDLGSSDLTISTDGMEIFGSVPTFHDISMVRQGSSNLLTGQVLVDWSYLNDMQLHIEWDATGLLNAIDYGLEVGHVLSGSDLYFDANTNGVQDAGEFVTDIYSASPFSDTLLGSIGMIVDGESVLVPPQGPAPLAATSSSQGLDETTPFPWLVGYFDIGSGNSMHVTAVSVVPVPAAVWLFGSGLIGLVALARKSG